MNKNEVLKLIHKEANEATRNAERATSNMDYTYFLGQVDVLEKLYDKVCDIHDEE
jgi:hypothetical protein